MDWSIFDNPRVDALIDALIVFGITIITELLALPGLPDFAAFYHAALVAFLAFLVFYGKRRSIVNHKNKEPPLPVIEEEED